MEATRGEPLRSTITPTKSAATTSESARATTESTTATTKATAAIHHAEDDLRVDATTHSTTHTPATTEHVVRVNKVFTTIITSTLPVIC